MQSGVRILVCWVMVFSVYFLIEAAQQVSWRDVVSYQKGDKPGEDLVEYKQGWVENFCDSVKTYTKNKTKESLKRVHELQKIIFPFTMPLCENEIVRLESELFVIDTEEQMSSDSLLVTRLFGPSQERIKSIAMKRGLVK